MDRLVMLETLLLLSCLWGCCSSVHVYEFQPNGEHTNSHLMYTEELSLMPLDALSFCVRLRFYYLWEVSGFLQVSDNSTGQLVHTVQAEINLNYIRVTLSKFRRYYFFKQHLRALTWHHLCVTYGQGVTITYLDGVEQDSHHADLGVPITGTQVKIGAWDAGNSYSGQISQANIWGHVLTAQEVAALADCTKETGGDIVSWQDPWTSVGDIVLSHGSLDDLCKEASGIDYFVLSDFTASEAYQVCEGIGGSVPTPESAAEYHTIMEAVNGYQIADDVSCETFWVGISDKEKEGVWTDFKHKSLFHPTWSVTEPDGDKLENCAVAEGPQQFADTRCDELNCAVCAVPRRPVWRIFGACEIYQRNIHLVALQDQSGKVIFRGYSDYQIKQNEVKTEWVWKNWRSNQTIATLSKAINGVPVGRQNWTLKKPMCGQAEGETRRLLLTHCTSGYFSCDDASCIPLHQRCDLKFDCRDRSDESGCHMVKFPPVYRQDLSPEINNDNNSQPLPITLYLTIESATVHTSSMHMHVNLNVSMTWQEARLSFLNLNEDYTLNRVPYETMQKVWVPVIDFTNTKGNHFTQTDQQTTMVVNTQGKPSLGDDTQPEELEVYSGLENPISVRRKYSITFQCQFDLKMYPFDEQYCHLELTMLSASSRLLVFNEAASTAIFQGNRLLVEYFVGDVDIVFQNDKDFAVMLIKLKLLRRSGFIIMNVYIPSLCLLVISYLTLYFTPTNFQVRILASLTSLLVVATLYTQASSSLPKTSYFKMVDVWLLSSIFFIFIIIIIHTIIDRTREWDARVGCKRMNASPTLSSNMPMSNYTSMTSMRINSPDNGAMELDETSRNSVEPSRRNSVGPSRRNSAGVSQYDTQSVTFDLARLRPLHEIIILASRVFVLVLLVVFHIIYWTVVLA